MFIRVKTPQKRIVPISREAKNAPNAINVAAETVHGRPMPPCRQSRGEAFERVVQVGESGDLYSSPPEII
jgi:hypothetical protein